MKTVFVNYYSENNFGDDLFLRVLLDRYPTTAFYTCSPRSNLQANLERNNLISIYPGPISTERKSDLLSKLIIKIRLTIAKFMAIKRSDCFIDIGGSIYIEPDAKYKAAKNFLKKAVDYKLAQSVYVLGANFGPWKTKHWIRSFRKLFNSECEDICFRDHASTNLFRSLNNVRYAPDLLFSFPVIRQKKNKKILFSVIDYSSWCRPNELKQYRENYERWILNSAKLFSKLNYVITICSFCKFEGDEDAVNRISEVLLDAGIRSHKLFYAGNIDEIVSEIASSEILVASRFHAFILGLSAGCKVIPVPYSKKTVNVMNDIGFPSSKSFDPSTQSSDDLSMYSDAFDAEAVDVIRLSREAEGHFAALDRVLCN